MQSAQKNIEALSAATSRSYYRLRQSSIDEDLFDVMTGFNSLWQKLDVRRAVSRCALPLRGTPTLETIIRADVPPG